MNKKYGLLLFLATIMICFIIFENNSYAATNKKQTISDSVILLEGNVDSYNYRYYVAEDIEKGKNELVLNVEMSSLLIKPSSITVKIDGEKVKTFALSGDKPSKKITVDLAKENVEKGSHDVVFEFYGSIKDGICVENSNSGNWLKIKPSSYLLIAGDVVTTPATLSDYPSKFIASNTNTNVIIPNKADELTIDSALKVASYLKKQAQKPNQIQLTFEDDRIDSAENQIYVGEDQAFSPTTNKLIAASKVSNKADALNLSISNAKNKKQVQTIMAIQADTSKNLNERIILVADNDFTGQLQKQQLSIQTVPSKENVSNGTVQFLNMDIRNVTLSNSNSTSSHYYYQIPNDIQQDKPIELSLQLTKSSILESKETELIVFVNDIPHPVDLKNIKANDVGELFAKVVVDPKIFNNKSLLDLQFALNGTAISDPCAVNIEDFNLFISENSELNYSIRQDKQLFNSNLRAFPAFVTVAEKPTNVVIEAVDRHTLVDLLSLYMIVSNEGKLPNVSLKLADSMSDKELGERHLIVIGSIEKWNETLLQNNPLVNEGEIDLAKAGFIKETTARYATIQTNPWNEDFLALQFDRVQSNVKIAPSNFLQKLQSLNVDASIVVQNDARDIFTNAQTFEVTKAKVLAQKNETNSAFNWQSTALFAALLVIIIIVIIVMVKRRRKKK